MSDPEEAPLMLTNGEEGPDAILQLNPPSGYERYGIVRQNHTAGSKVRPRGTTERSIREKKFNSLNLTGTNILTNRNE